MVSRPVVKAQTVGHHRGPRLMFCAGFMSRDDAVEAGMAGLAGGGVATRQSCEDVGNSSGQREWEYVRVAYRLSSSVGDEAGNHAGGQVSMGGRWRDVGVVVVDGLKLFRLSDDEGWSCTPL